MLSQRRPLFSLYEDDLDLEDDLHDFVVGLAATVDELQDAGSNRDLGILTKLSLALVNDASRFGYPPLQVVAQSVHSASEGGKEDAIEDALIDLTEIARRIRLGHHGAA